MVLGCGTLDEAVDLLHRDVPRLMGYKFKASLDFHGTPSEVFDEVLEELRAFSDATDLGKMDPDAQARVLSRMGMSWYVKGLYNLVKGSETLVQFMERAILEGYRGRGWSFAKKSKQEVIKLDPALGLEMTGDLVSIKAPKAGGWTFPADDERYFGVQTEISEKLAWINVMAAGAVPYWVQQGHDDLPSG